jgi:hypothetical protein
MAGEDAQIDQAQAELAAEAKAEKGAEVREAEDIFKAGGLVDSFQSLETSLKLNTAEAKKYYQTGKREVKALLFRMAEEAHEDEKEPEARDLTDIAENLRSTLAKYREKLPLISSVVEAEENAFPFLTKLLEVESSPEVINARPNFPDVLIKALNEALYGAGGNGGALNVRKIMRNNFGLPPDFVKEVDNQFSEDKIQKILERKITAEQQKATFEEKIDDVTVAKYARVEPSKKDKGTYEVVFTPEGEGLPKEKKQQILMMLGGIRTAALEQAESASCLKVTEPFWAGKALFENGLFEEAKTQFQAYLDKSYTSSDAQYQKQKASYEAQAKDYLAKIETVIGGNKDFFEGQNLAMSGDIFGAKKLLKKYLDEHKQKKEGQQDFSASARELLKRIALTQCADAKDKFKIHTAPPETVAQRTSDPMTQTEIVKMVPNPDYAKFCKYRDAITQIEQDITAGKYIDFTDAYNAIAAKIPGGFDSKEDFNVMADQVTLDKGREGLLELARKYQAKGKYFGDAKYLAVAEQYFTQYFGKKLEETAKRSVTIEEVRSHYLGRPYFAELVSERLEQEKKRYDKLVQNDPDWAATHPWNEETVKKAIQDSALSELQREETLKRQNSDFNLNPNNVGNAADQAAWGEFMSMKGMHGQGKWNEMFALSDETVGKLIKEMPIDIAMIAAAGALASATGGAMSGLVLEAWSRAAAVQLGRQAVTFGARSALRQFAAYGLGLGVETLTFTVSHSAMNAVRTGELSILYGDKFREEWAGNLEVMGMLGMVGRMSHAMQFGRVGAFGAEMVGMGALNGRLTPEDWAMVIGLRIGHSAPAVREAAAKAGEKVAKYREKRAETRKAKGSIPEEARLAKPAEVTPLVLRERTAYIESGSEVYTKPAGKSETTRAEELVPERDQEADRAFRRECEERLKAGQEEYLRWKRQLDDPQQFVMADRIQRGERRGRINQAIFALADIQTPADAMAAIERINAGREISPGMEWEIIKNLEGFDMAIVLEPDGQLHLFNSSADQYDFASHSLRLKGNLRRWEKMDPETRSAEILSHVEYLRQAFESGEISAEAREEILSRAGSDIREIFDNPSAEKIHRITPEQMKRLRETVLKLRNEKFRTDRAAAREKANKTIELSATIEKTMREQMEKNPDITREELYRILDLENNPLFKEANFDDFEKAKLKFVVESLFQKAKSINEYYRRFQNNPSGLCEEVFGFRPIGEIKLGKSIFSIFFEFSDVRDYNRITGNTTARAWALRFGRSKVAALDGSVVIIRNDPEMTDKGNVPVEVIVDHEEQHNINKYIFRALQPGYHESPLLDLRGETDPVKKLAIIERHNEKEYQYLLILAKDEIMAFTRQGLSPDEIWKKFQKGGSYDYWERDQMEIIAEELGSSIGDIIFQVEDMNDRLGERFRNEIKEALKAAKRINDPGLLMITDIRHWRSLRLPEKVTETRRSSAESGKPAPENPSQREAEEGRKEKPKQEQTELTPERLSQMSTLHVTVNTDLSPILAKVNEALGLNLVGREGEQHITIISPTEAKVLKNLTPAQIAEIQAVAAEIASGKGITIKGIGFIDGSAPGMRSADSGKKTAFIALDIPALNAIREKLGLPQKDFHITLGFEGGDIHMRVKGKDAKGKDIVEPVPKQADPKFDKLLEGIVIEFGALSGERKQEGKEKKKKDTETSPVFSLETNGTFRNFRRVEITEFDETKPWKPPKTARVTLESGEVITVDASTPFFTIRGPNGRRLVVSAADAGHIHDLHIAGKEAGSRFDYPSVEAMLQDAMSRIPPDVFTSKGVSAFAVEMGKRMGQEGIATMGELMGDGVISFSDVNVAIKYKEQVIELNRSGSKEDKERFIQEYKEAHPDNKIQFQLVRGEVLIPVVVAPKRATTKLFMVFGPSDTVPDGKTMYTAAPGRNMPRHPNPKQFREEEGGANGTAFRESADAWFDTVMLVEGPKPQPE